MMQRITQIHWHGKLQEFSNCKSNKQTARESMHPQHRIKCNHALLCESVEWQMLWKPFFRTLVT